MAAVISQTSRMEWTAEHTDCTFMSHAKTQRRKGDGESVSRSEEAAGDGRALKGDVVGLNVPKSPLVGFAVAGLEFVSMLMWYCHLEVSQE
jgi:hypothetical protein